MNNSAWFRIAAGGLLGFTQLMFDPASASRKADELIGTITSTPIGNRIYVDGSGYSVVPSTQLSNKLSTLRLGDRVDLLMNGSPFDKNSRVVDFVVLSKRGE